jgi:hypothetical protein
MSSCLSVLVFKDPEAPLSLASSEYFGPVWSFNSLSLSI